MTRPDPHDVAPLCGNCGRSMNERAGNQHFCPHDAEYGRFTGTIHPTDPAHPVFEDVLEDDPEIVVGMTLLRYPYPHGEEYIGTIARHTNENVYVVESDTDEPFHWTERYIEYETFVEYLWTPDGPRDTAVPEELRLGVHP